jgi:Family of unknown function (DUF6134)
MGENAAGPEDWAHAGLGRRAFLTGGAAAGLALPVLLRPSPARAALSGIPADGKVAFKVMRKGAHIGEHTLRFEQDGDNLTVHVDIRITVHIGPVPVYHHTQRCTEHWKGDRFMALESSTSSNISQQTVNARRTSDGVRIEPADGQPFTAPAEVLPLTHWNRFAYQGPLFDPQAGKVLKETLVSRTDDMVMQADGSSIRATRWSVTGDGVMDDYYDANGVWAGLHVKVRDGSQVEYLRL